MQSGAPRHQYYTRIPSERQVVFWGFSHVDERFAEMVDNFFEFYQRVTNDPRAKERLFDWLFEEYRRRKGEG